MRRLLPYLLLGALLWVSVLKSGVHATLAGVVLALFIPLKSAGEPDEKRPAIRLEHVIKPWSAWLIMPVFAFANAGLPLGGLSLASLAAPLPLGIMAGLFIGKQIGIVLGAGLLIVLGVARLPQGATWRGLYGVAILGGIGFTMSLFIGTLAFPDDATREAEVRLGVLAGSHPVRARGLARAPLAAQIRIASRRLRVALAGLYFPAMRRTSYEQMNCSIASALDVVGEPWTLLIVRDAFYGVRRFDDFQENLGIARNVLTARLKKLVEAGIFRKTAYRQRPLRHEYRLTDKGAALFTVIVGLKQWGDRYGAAARSGKPMDLVNRGDGRPLEPVLIDADSGQRLELTNVRAVAGPGADQGTRAFFERLAINRPPRQRRPLSVAIDLPCRRPRARRAVLRVLVGGLLGLGAAEAPAVGIGLALALLPCLVLASASQVHDLRHDPSS